VPSPKRTVRVLREERALAELVADILKLMLLRECVREREELRAVVARERVLDRDRARGDGRLLGRGPVVRCARVGAGSHGALFVVGRRGRGRGVCGRGRVGGRHGGRES
jgi:hypothetical protein